MLNTGIPLPVRHMLDEGELQISNLTGLINSTNALLWSVDRELSITAANIPFLHMIKTMFGPELAIGMSALRPLDGETLERRRWERHYRRALAGERVVMFEERERPERHARITFNPVLRSGRVAGVACFAQDVTIQTITERELRRNEADLLASQRIAQVGSWEMDLGNAAQATAPAIHCTDEAHRIFGLMPCGSMINPRRFLKIMHPDDRAKFHRTLALALRNGGLSSFDHRVVRADGTIRAVHEEFRVVRDPSTGRNLKMIGTVQDVTGQMHIEAEIRSLNMDLERRVVDRTGELVLANEKLEADAYSRDILAKALALQKQEHIASLRYARNIQVSLQPTDSQLAFFAGHGCLYEPRDIVGGDLYWVHANEERIHVAVGDCTGHGVPGALLTMVGHNILNNLVLEDRTIHPDVMLAEADQALYQFFARHHAGASHINDGMDIALCSIDRASLRLSFAGAALDAIVLRKGELIELKAAKVHLGGHEQAAGKRFTRMDMQLQKGDRLILGTDGIMDQFGGERDKKLLRAGYQKWLLEGAGMAMGDAMKLLKKRFHAWKGDHPQVDDALLVMLDI